MGACADPPGEGGLQLYFDVNVDAAAAMGLADLESFEIVTDQVTLKFDSPHFDGTELVLNDTTQTTSLPAVTQVVPGPYYNLPTGFITQFRFYPTSVRFHFLGGATAEVRVPSAYQTGWKGVVDETVAPNGYELKAHHVTGVRLFIDLAELFHYSEPQGWMARPTIRTNLYNIAADEGHDPDILVVVFDPATPQATIDTIINDRGFTVELAYPHSTKLYKLRKPIAMSLPDAHAYLRGFSAVKAAAPSVRILARQLIPNEGLPIPMNVIGASLGWEAMANTTGSVGSPSVVLAELSAASGGVNIEHIDLWPNVWLNQGEILPVCGTIAQCDPDGDGIVTPKDFNNAAFTGVRPPDSDGNGRYTCKDLLAVGSPYVNNNAAVGNDDDGNGYADDLCGWNFITNTNDVVVPLCDPAQGDCNIDHDTADAGIMAAAAGTSAGNPNQGPGVGLCWNCRFMPIVVGLDPGGIGGRALAEDVRGVTFELVAGMLYARHNGAHVANLSAGGDYFRKDSPQHCADRELRVRKEEIFDTMVTELNAVITESMRDLFLPTTLFTLAAGECGGASVDQPGIDEAASDDYYNWPGEAFWSSARTRAISLSVAASANGNLLGELGCLSTFSNFGESIEVAGPGERWATGPLSPGVLCGTPLNDTASCRTGGTSAAAPTVAGVAGLIASGNLGTFGTPNGAVLKQILLNVHTSEVAATPQCPNALRIPGNRGLTMLNLP